MGTYVKLFIFVIVKTDEIVVIKTEESVVVNVLIIFPPTKYLLSVYTEVFDDVKFNGVIETLFKLFDIVIIPYDTCFTIVDVGTAKITIPEPPLPGVYPPLPPPPPPPPPVLLTPLVGKYFAHIFAPAPPPPIPPLAV